MRKAGISLLTPLPSLTRNYIFTSFSAFIGIVYPVVTLAYFARIAGPMMLGRYYFASSLANYFLFAACLGIPIYGAREIGRARGNLEHLKNVFSELFALNLISSVVVWILYMAMAAIVPQFRAEFLLFGIFGFLLLGNVFMFDPLYTGLEQQGSMAFRSVVSKVVSLLLIYLVVKTPSDYPWFAAIVVFSAVSYNLLGMGGMKYWLGMHRFHKFQIRRHMGSLIWFLLSLLFINVYINLDSVLLGFLTSPREVGLYNAAIRPCRLVAMVLASFSAASLPRLAYYAAEDHTEASRELKNKSFNLLCLLSLPLACTIALSAPMLIPLIYGAKFTDAIPTLVYSAPLVVLNGVAGFILYQILFPSGREWILAAIAGVGALASVVANLILVPAWGRNGAVLAALIAEAASIVVQIVFIRRLYPEELVFPNQLWKYALATAGLAVTLWGSLHGLPASYSGLFAAWGISTSVYAGLLWATRESLFHQVVRRVLQPG